MTPTITQDDVLTALRAFLLAVLPSGVEAVQGQGNRVPMPAGDSVVFTPLRRQQLSTTHHDYDPPVDPVPAIGSENIGRPTAIHVQLDVYGETSGENAQVITNVLRDEWGATFLKTYGVAPLYCDDPSQMPLVAGEQQYIQRWTIAAALQANIAVTVPMEFADTLITTLHEGDSP